jgi:ABC-type oligopeptide transport system substrate-binding subunit/tetratricopeptide (TPR) repeat protein
MTGSVFVGRERELGRLHKLLDQAFNNAGQVVFIAGEAGSGKTALVREFARRAQTTHANLVVALGDCNAQIGLSDPYLPFREVLQLLSGDVEADLAENVINAENATRLRRLLTQSVQVLIEISPDLVSVLLAGIPGAGLLTSAGKVLAEKAGLLDRLEALIKRKPKLDDTNLEQSHIFEQYTNFLVALAAKQPLMLVLDDLQWADTASLSLLFHLGRRIGKSRMLIAGLYRPDEVALGRGKERHPLEKVLTESKRYFGDVWIDLEQAEDIEARQFVDALLDTEPNRFSISFRQALFQHTGGHPLFTIELLRDMRERGDLLRDEKGRWLNRPALDWKMLPARVEGVTEERIGRLDETLREMLSVASVEGEEFTAQVVARVLEMKERQVLQKLSQELEKRHHLVRELRGVKVGFQVLSRYRFAHAVFQQYLYNELGTGERRLLHGEIAHVLEGLYQGRTEEIAVQLARHYTEAGEGQKAMGYLLQVGDKARELYAHQEAIAAYQQALMFLKEQGEYARAARTLMKLGLTYHTAFDFRQARQAYEEGFTLWQQAGRIRPAVPLRPAPHALRVLWNHPWTLDPIMAGEGTSMEVIEHLFSGLAEWSSEGDVVPDVARTWEVLEGGRSYIFHLREDVLWSDSTSVTARDFEYAWKRRLDPATGSPNARLLFDVKGARAFHQGETSDPDTIGVKAVDEFTLAVELEEPTGYFPFLLAQSATYPVPRHVVEALGENWTEVEHIVSNGPFNLEVWQRKQSLVLTRNPRYHGKSTGNVQRVELPWEEDDSIMWELYDAGDLDIVASLPPEWIDSARRRCPGDIISGPALYTWYVGFNISQPPFDDPRVRQAFVLATDRETLTAVVKRGYEFPATGGFIPPGMPGHSAGIGLPYNPGRARQLLYEAGYPGGDDFPIVDLLAEGDFDERQYLETQWREILGVEITWRTMEYERFIEKLDREPPSMFLTGCDPYYPDPDSVLRIKFPKRWTRWQNEVYNRLVEEARRITDQVARLELYQQADQILVEEAAIVPLTYGRWYLLVKPWVRNLIVTAPIKAWFWKDVIIEPH